MFYYSISVKSHKAVYDCTMTAVDEYQAMKAMEELKYVLQDLTSSKVTKVYNDYDNRYWYTTRKKVALPDLTWECMLQQKFSDEETYKILHKLKWEDCRKKR